MRLRLFASAALLLLTACAAPLSQTPPAGVAAEAPMPDVRVGDSWRYAVRDGFTNLPRGTVDYRVSAIDGDTISLEVRDGERVSTELYTRGGNWLRRPATNMQVFSYSPPYEAFAFPLAPGKTWKARSMATDPADGRRFPVIVEGAVLGWERIRTPAGEFDALKVSRRVFLDYWLQAVRGQSIIEEYEWYVPALKQAAKRQTSSLYLSYIFSENDAGFILRAGRDDGGGPRYIRDDWLIYELVRYELR